MTKPLEPNYDPGHELAPDHIAWLMIELSGPMIDSTGNDFTPIFSDPTDDYLIRETQTFGTCLHFFPHDGVQSTFTLNDLDHNLWPNFWIAFWFKPQSQTYDPAYLISTGHGDFVTIDSSKLHITTNGGFPEYESPTTLTPDSWYHFCLVGDGTSLKLYLNGVLDIDEDFEPGQTYYDLKAFGRYYGGGSPEAYLGYIDSILVSKNTLTDVQVAALYDDHWAAFRDNDNIEVLDVLEITEQLHRILEPDSVEETLEIFEDLDAVRIRTPRIYEILIKEKLIPIETISKISKSSLSVFDTLHINDDYYSLRLNYYTVITVPSIIVTINDGAVKTICQ